MATMIASQPIACVDSCRNRQIVGPCPRQGQHTHRRPLRIQLSIVPKAFPFPLPTHATSCCRHGRLRAFWIGFLWGVWPSGSISEIGSPPSHAHNLDCKSVSLEIAASARSVARIVSSFERANAIKFGVRRSHFG